MYFKHFHTEDPLHDFNAWDAYMNSSTVTGAYVGECAQCGEHLYEADNRFSCMADATHLCWDCVDNMPLADMLEHLDASREQVLSAFGWQWHMTR